MAAPTGHGRARGRRRVVRARTLGDGIPRRVAAPPSGVSPLLHGPSPERCFGSCLGRVAPSSGQNVIHRLYNKRLWLAGRSDEVRRLELVGGQCAQRQHSGNESVGGPQVEHGTTDPSPNPSASAEGAARGNSTGHRASERRANTRNACSSPEQRRLAAPAYQRTGRRPARVTSTRIGCSSPE